MTLGADELAILACMYRKRIIGASHRRVDSIAGLCHIRNKKGLKKILKQLVRDGFLIPHGGPGFSLTDIGWRVGAKRDEGQSIADIAEFIQNEKTR